MRSEMSPNKQFFPEKDNVNPNAEIIPEQIPAAGSEKHGGPRTPQGKENSKKNSLKHGIFSRVLLLKGESRSDFNVLLNGLRDHFQPVGPFEELLVDKLVAIIWRIRRLIKEDREQSQGESYLAALSGPNRLSLDLLLRYESNLERAFERTLNQLERAQRMRRGQPVLPPINLNIAEC